MNVRFYVDNVRLMVTLIALSAVIDDRIHADTHSVNHVNVDQQSLLRNVHDAKTNKQKKKKKHEAQKTVIKTALVAMAITAVGLGIKAMMAENTNVSTHENGSAQINKPGNLPTSTEVGLLSRSQIVQPASQVFSSPVDWKAIIKTRGTDSFVTKVQQVLANNTLEQSARIAKTVNTLDRIDPIKWLWVHPQLSWETEKSFIATVIDALDTYYIEQKLSTFSTTFISGLKFHAIHSAQKHVLGLWCYSINREKAMINAWDKMISDKKREGGSHFNPEFQQKALRLLDLLREFGSRASNVMDENSHLNPQQLGFCPQNYIKLYVDDIELLVHLLDISYKAQRISGVDNFCANFFKKNFKGCTTKDCLLKLFAKNDQALRNVLEEENEWIAAYVYPDPELRLVDTIFDRLKKLNEETISGGVEHERGSN